MKNRIIANSFLLCSIIVHTVSTNTHSSFDHLLFKAELETKQKEYLQSRMKECARLVAALEQSGIAFDMHPAPQYDDMNEYEKVAALVVDEIVNEKIILGKLCYEKNNIGVYKHI